MRYFFVSAQKLFQDELGTTSIEYGLIGSLISVIIVGAVAILGSQVCERFSSVASALGAAGVACV